MSAMTAVLTTATIACASPLTTSVKAQSNDSYICQNVTGSAEVNAINAAKKAYSHYLGINIDQKSKQYGLNPRVTTCDDNIIVQYQPGSDHNYTVIMSQKDYSLVGITAEDFISSPEYSKKYYYDQNKVKNTAVNFLKNKGIDAKLKDKGINTDNKKITLDETDKSDAVIMALCTYDNGSSVLVSVNVKDFSVIGFDYCTSK